jgi:hypothetical protein
MLMVFQLIINRHLNVTRGVIFCINEQVLHYFSPSPVSFVRIGENIQYSTLINFLLIILLIFTCNDSAAQKNEKKKTSRRQYGIKNYFYSDSLTRPRNVKNKYVILRQRGDMCLLTSALRALKTTYRNLRRYGG